MGQDEEPFAAVRRADFLRCKQDRRSAVAHALKVREDFTTSESQMSADVLEKAPSRRNCVHNAGDVGPEVAGVVVGESLPCVRERLARVAANDAIHSSTESSGVESLEVAPNRCRIQRSRFHVRRQDAAGCDFVLHVADRSRLWMNESHGSVEPATAGAQAEVVVAGMYNHNYPSDR